tara:strand:- start:392 stop:847 length:456 start_codon:yes stop_codon:yes gene_type:complete
MSFVQEGRKGCVKKGGCNVDDDDLKTCYDCNASGNVLTCACCLNKDNNNCVNKDLNKDETFKSKYNTSVTLCDITSVDNNNGNLVITKCDSHFDWSKIGGVILIVVIIVLVLIGLIILYYIYNFGMSIVYNTDWYINKYCYPGHGYDINCP